jgi:hypothetical protein
MALANHDNLFSKLESLSFISGITAKLYFKIFLQDMEMDKLSYIAHKTLELFYRKSYQSFVEDMCDFKRVQLNIFKKHLFMAENTVAGVKAGIKSNWDYDEFSKQLPVTDYDYWEYWISEQRKGPGPALCQNCRRFQPTSGSTDKRKWIPYSAELLDEFDRAIGPWLCDIYKSYPRIKDGKHYWSLSWLPDNLRDEMDDTDDLTYFPWWKRVFMKLTVVPPANVALAESSEAAHLATICYLCATQNLTMIFVWSPTFAISFLEELSKRKSEIVEILISGDWGDWTRQMKGLVAPKSNRAANIVRSWDGIIEPKFLKELWPKLALLSSWDTGTSAPWAKKLKDYFPHSDFQGKGLFATEGVVTIPFEGKHVLSYKSHFYEFQCLESNIIYPSWELQKDQQVSPIITTGNGLFRYRLNDRLVVDGFNRGVPCLKFLGRLSGVDMVGEKMSPETATELIEYLCTIDKTPLVPVSLLAVKNIEKKPCYVALIEGDKRKVDTGMLDDLGEKRLQEYFHYRVAREVGQLDPFRTLISSDAFKYYHELSVEKGMIAGSVKLEPLTLVDRLLK